MDKDNNLVDIAELCRDDFVNARRSIDNVKELFKHFSKKIPVTAKEDMAHAMCSLAIAIQEAIPEILGARPHNITEQQSQPLRVETSRSG